MTMLTRLHDCFVSGTVELTDLDRPSAEDIAVLEKQLGRPVRNVVAIGARCRCGRPLVAVTAPLLDDGSPFPTTFYLTHPAAIRACSTLEAEHYMDVLQQWLAEDEEVRQHYERAHGQYLTFRSHLGEVPQIAQVSAGGMPTRVKCLHALVGYSLAAGAGINPIGDRAIQMCIERGLWDPNVCCC